MKNFGPLPYPVHLSYIGFDRQGNPIFKTTFCHFVTASIRTVYDSLAAYSEIDKVIMTVFDGLGKETPHEIYQENFKIVAKDGITWYIRPFLNNMHSNYNIYETERRKNKQKHF